MENISLKLYRKALKNIQDDTLLKRVELELLLYAKECEYFKQGDLFINVPASRQTMVYCIKYLLQEEYLSMVKDGRPKLYSITSKGSRLVNKIYNNLKI